MVTIALGLGLGLAWGVLARGWMRLISDSPEFTWSGTLYIVLAPTIIGGMVGLAFAARSGTRRGRWVMAARTAAGVSMILIGVGAGMIMLPTIFLGGLAISRDRFPWPVRLLAAAGLLLGGVATGVARSVDPVALAVSAVIVGVVVALLAGWRVRVLLAGLAVLPVVLVMFGILFDTDLPWWRLALGAAAYPALLIPALWAMRLVLHPAVVMDGGVVDVTALRPLEAAAS